MTKKIDRLQPTIFKSDGNPNALSVSMFPDKIGDICIDTTNKRFYFAHGLGSGEWGTAGTSLT